MTWGLGIPLIALCVASQAFFSGSEMALVSANKVKLQAAAESGSAGAGLALDLLKEDDRLLGTCLIGTNVSLVTGATLVATMLATNGVSAQWVATAVFAPIALTFGEAVPKTVLGHYADTWSPFVARPLGLIQWLFTPFLLVVSAWNRLLERIGDDDDHQVSRQDVVDLLANKDGGIDPEDKKLIRNLFAMNDAVAESCMTPLVDVLAVEESATVAEATEIVLRYGHSRLPVYRERIDNIIGVVDHRALLFCEDTSLPVAGCAEPVTFVPEVKPLDELLQEMRSGPAHLAVVVDEYGGSVGLVTMEDLLEELVGEIRDERDRAGPRVRRLGRRDWRVPARTEIDELSETIGHPFPDGDFETVAGLILTTIGRIPEPGEEIRIGRFVFHVEVASDRAIQTVRLTVDSA